MLDNSSERGMRPDVALIRATQMEPSGSFSTTGIADSQLPAANQHLWASQFIANLGPTGSHHLSTFRRRSAGRQAHPAVGSIQRQIGSWLAEGAFSVSE